MRKIYLYLLSLLLLSCGSLAAQTAAPVVSPAGGTYSTAQTLTLTNTSGAPLTCFAQQPIPSLAGLTKCPNFDGTTSFSPTTYPLITGQYPIPSGVALKTCGSGTCTWYFRNGGGSFADSTVTSATYMITAANPIINYPSGFGSGCDSANIWLENNATCSGTSLYVVPHAVHNASLAWYKTPQDIQNFTTTFTFHISCTFQPSRCGAGFGFEVMSDPNYKTPGGGPYTYSGDSDQFAWSQCHEEVFPVVCPDSGLSVANGFIVNYNMYNYTTSTGTQNMTGYYEGPNEFPNDSTGAGQPNPVPFQDMTSAGINLGSGDEFTSTITAISGTSVSMSITDLVTHATYSHTWTPNSSTPGTGYLQTMNFPSIVSGNSAMVGFGGGTATFLDDVFIDSWTYSVGGGTPTVATPTFSPAAGTYSSTQTVTISSITPGSTITWGTTGTPTTPYTGPVTVSTSETLFAFANASGHTQSTTGSATYVISVPTAATPVIGPSTTTIPPKTQNTPITVTITDSTSGAVIHYTVDGTTPTTSSTVYSAPFVISMGSIVVKAIAAASGFANSLVANSAGAAYTVTGPYTSITNNAITNNSIYK